MNKTQLHVRIPSYTAKQIDDLQRQHGLTKTQLVITAIQSFKDHSQTYNGWPNYETWAVNNWLRNDQGSDHHLDQLLEDNPDDYDAADQIQGWVAEMDPLGGTSSLFADLMGAALREVDWVEIARANRG